MVREYDLGPLLNAAGQDRKIIRNLQRLLYSADKLFRYQACDALGKVSAIIARDDPGTISRLLQKLFAALSDTAASSWGSLDAIGDIIKNCPEYFAGYAPQIFQYAKDRELLPDVLRALGKVGEGRPDVLRNKTFHFVPLLQDPDPEVRGYAAMLLGNLGAGEATEDLEKLSSDQECLEIYSEGNLETRTVAQLAEEAIQKI
jgi:HEAT repeat protein